MRRISPRSGWLLLVACLFGSWRVGVLTAEVSPWPLSQEMLSHAQLRLVWQGALAVEEGERLDAVMVLEDRLYARSGRNYVWSLDRGNGKVVFSRSIAPAGYPILGWVPYQDELITVIDNQLVEFDKNSGAQRRISDLELSIVAPPVRNSRFFYVSAADRRLHAFRSDDMVRLFQVAAANSSLITSVLADEDMVVMGTSAGNLIALAADAPRRLWQFDAADAVAGPVVRDGRSFFFASKDTNVYRVDMVGASIAEMIWRFQTEAILDREPRVTATAVYQYALGRGLTAIDKRSGQALWFLPEGIDLLAEAGGRAYVITRFKTLVVMDNAAGKRLYSVNFSPVTKHASNAADANIYVADEQGHIACLRPAP